MLHAFVEITTSVGSTTSVADVVRLMGDSQPQLSAIFVADGEKLVGQFTEGALLPLVAQGRSLAELTVAEVMQRPVISVQQADLSDISAAVSLLQQHATDCLAVVDGRGALVGAITRGRLQPYLGEAFQAQQAELTHQQELVISLSQSAAQYQSLLQALPDLVIRTSAEGVYLDRVGSADFELYLDEPDLVGKRGDEILPAELAAQRLKYIQQALQTGELQIYDQQIVIKGSLRTEEVRINVCGNSEVLVIVRDITDRKTLEDTNRAILDAIPDLLVRINRQGQYLEILRGDSVKNVLLPPADCSGCTVYDLLPPTLARQKVQAAQQALDTGTVQMYEQQIEIDGELCWEEVRVTPVNPDEVLLMIRDISERKHSEAERQRAKLALAQSEATQRAILAAIPDLLVRVSATGRYLDFIGPDRSFNLFTPALVTPHGSIADLLPPELAQPQLTAIARALETRELQVYEQQFQVGDRLQYEELRAVYIDDGEVLLMIRDISDRKRSEAERKQAEIALQELNHELEARVAQRTAALQESEERWQLALQGSDASLWDWNVKTGEIFRTRRWHELRGLAEDAVGGTPEEWSNRIHPDDRDRVLAAMADHLAQKTAFYQQEYRLCHAGGHYPWILDRGQAVWDEAGNPTRIIGSEMDITQRKQAELEAQTLKQQLEFVLSSSPAAIFTCQLDGNTTFMSDNIVNLTGHTPAEFLSRPDFWTIHLHPEDAPRLLAELPALFDQGQHIHEYRFLHKAGHYVWIRNELRLIHDAQGTPVEIVGYFADIGDRKRGEAERQQAEDRLQQINDQLMLINAELDRATRLKDEFLANMSHELRTPLNAILGMSEGLKEHVFGRLSDRQRQAVETIERSGTHLLDLINDILDLSKIEADKLELETALVNVHYLCESSLTFVQQLAFSKGIELSLESMSPMPDIVVDERRIRQILINLLSNAVKFTPSGGQVTLGARVERHNNSDYLKLSVTDTGIGIAPADIAKLFQPFVQIDSRLSRQYNGTGLGLALVRKLAELHGGTVSVTSEINRGSCFTLALPWLTELPLPVIATPAPLSSPLDAHNCRVLVIEDSAAAADLIARYLQEQGMEVILCPRGDRVMDDVIEVQPGLIILDILLPNRSGWDVLRQLKTTPDTLAIPVIVVSVVDERAYGLSLGASDYLVKPISRHQLQQAIERLLQGPQPSRSAGPMTPPPNPATSAVASPLILLAEDNDMNVATVSSYLTALGYRLIYAKNGRAAVELAQTQTPDLILMDIQMPEMDGLEAMQLLRSNARCATIPIVALTALAMPGDRDRCLAAGANHYLSKPFKMKELKGLIQQLLPPV